MEKKQGLLQDKKTPAFFCPGTARRAPMPYNPLPNSTSASSTNPKTPPQWREEGTTPDAEIPPALAGGGGDPRGALNYEDPPANAGGGGDPMRKLSVTLFYILCFMSSLMG